MINQKLPEFKLKGYHKDDFKDFSNKDLEKKWSVLFFYPADFTFVCPTELEDMADHYKELKKLKVEVYSVSCDTHFSHKAWHDSSEKIKKIKFPMLADPTGNLSKDLGIYIEEEGVSYRATFLIDSDGNIKIVEIHDNGIGRNASELIRKIKAAQFVRDNGEVCPANWNTGDKTLKPSVDLVGKL